MLTEAVNSTITTLFCIVLKSLTIPPGGRFSCWGGGGGGVGVGGGGWWEGMGAWALVTGNSRAATILENPGKC